MVRIVKEECIGCRICTDICSEKTEIKNGGDRLKNKNANCLKNDANVCPRNAIILDEETDENIKLGNFSARLTRRRGIELGREV